MEQLPVSLENPLSIPNGFLVCVFANSKSQNIAAALNIAQQAWQYSSISIGDNIFHIANFEKTAHQISLSIALYSLIHNWKGSQFFINGTPITDNGRMYAVLGCYSESLRCADYKAHCHIIVKNLVINSEKQKKQTGFFISLFSNQTESDSDSENCWMHPCRYFGQGWGSQLDFRHPSSIEDQLQAQAIRNGCDWCPSFNASELKKLK